MAHDTGTSTILTLPPTRMILLVCALVRASVRACRGAVQPPFWLLKCHLFDRLIVDLRAWGCDVRQVSSSRHVCEPYLTQLAFARGSLRYAAVSHARQPTLRTAERTSCRLQKLYVKADKQDP